MITAESIIKAVAENAAGDSTLLDLIARYIAEAEQAKRVLREKGYGWSGLNLALTAEQVPRNE